jgi:hypothetical protein
LKVIVPDNHTSNVPDAQSSTSSSSNSDSIKPSIHRSNKGKGPFTPVMCVSLSTKQFVLCNYIALM